jgi:hypothetical protein
VGRDRPEAQLAFDLREPRVRPRRQEPESKSLPLIFVHVPKTGGSTVGSVLRLAYPGKSVPSLGNGLTNPHETQARVERLAAATRRVRAITGHAPFGLLKAQFGEGARFATVLREPVDRTLSHYFWLTGADDDRVHLFPTRSGPRPLPTPSPETPVEEMLERGVYLLDNLATRLLCDRTSAYGELSAADLDDARRNLREHFELVGLTERLPESIALLERLIGVGPVPFTSQKVNRGRPGVEEVSQERKAVVAAHNRYDLELYSLARELFDEQVAAAPGLEEEADALERISEAAETAPKGSGTLARVNGGHEVDPSALDEVRRLEQMVADVRAEMAVETSELRAHVRELERRVEELTGSPPVPADPGHRAKKRPKAERVAAKKEARAVRGGKPRARARADANLPGPPPDEPG